MKRVQFITLEDDGTDLVVSFALAPRGSESLTLLRAPHYEYLLPEEDRRATVSLSSSRELGDYLKSVVWQRDRVEVTSERHQYVFNAAAISDEDRKEALVVLRKMLDEGNLRAPAA